MFDIKSKQWQKENITKKTKVEATRKIYRVDDESQWRHESQ